METAPSPVPAKEPEVKREAELRRVESAEECETEKTPEIEVNLWNKPEQRKVFEALRDAPPEGLTTMDIARALFGADIQTKSERFQAAAKANIVKHISRLRKALTEQTGIGGWLPFQSDGTGRGGGFFRLRLPHERLPELRLSSAPVV